MLVALLRWWALAWRGARVRQCASIRVATSACRTYGAAGRHRGAGPLLLLAASCHAYPPADAFPKSHWRMEVERGFRFFDKSGLSLNPPKLGHVVRYYEERARDDYAPAKIVPAAKPLDIQFERLAYPPTPPDSKPMISNIQVVRMQPPGVTDPAAIAREPFTLLASDMKDGRILALKPRDAAPAWKEIAKVPHPGIPR